MTISCHLHALGKYVPGAVITNDDLAHKVDTNDRWIVERTGIHERHELGEEENASSLGLKAANEALKESGTSVSTLTHVIAATCTPDYLSPSVACIIAGQLDAPPVMAFDIGAACTGFIYGLSVCRSMLAAEPQSKILFVCTEALTRRLNWTDRGTCVLFGDAAVACVMDSSAQNSVCSVRDVICQSDGKQKDLIIVGGGTSCRYKPGDMVDGDFFITMQGRDTYRHAVRQMVSVCEAILERNNLTISDIDILVPHQANMRIIEAVGTRLKIPASKVFTNVANYGNTSSASIPLAIVEAGAANRIPSGALMLVTAFGAGLTWGAALLQF